MFAKHLQTYGYMQQLTGGMWVLFLTYKTWSKCFSNAIENSKRKTNGPIESLSRPKKKEDTIEID